MLFRSDNTGSFDGGAGTVRFVDGCGVSSSIIAGSTEFASLELTTTTGKLYQLASGSTQSVADSLWIAGAFGNRLQLRSTLSGVSAAIDVQGETSTLYVDVDDNYATGQAIEYDETSILGANTLGWLFSSAGVPGLTPGGWIALAALLLGGGLRSRGDRSRGVLGPSPAELRIRDSNEPPAEPFPCPTSSSPGHSGLAGSHSRAWKPARWSAGASFRRSWFAASTPRYAQTLR